MDTMTTLRAATRYTRVDLDAMPDDGRRHELIDGVLVVTPAPSVRHQEVLASLHLVLARACPPALGLFLAPLDVAIADDTVMQPDLLVATRRLHQPRPAGRAHARRGDPLAQHSTLRPDDRAQPL